MPGLHEIQIGIIQVGTISIEAPNRNSQLDIYIKSLSNGYQSQLILKSVSKIKIYQSYYERIIYKTSIFCFSNRLYSKTLSTYIYILMETIMMGYYADNIS